MLSDLTNLVEIHKTIKFEVGSPLKPFEQLMGCLPPASAEIVPQPYRKLMCSIESPLIEFYPKQFEVDMNGKKNPWEGVNILPFINVSLLKTAIAQHCPDKLLTYDEKKRNTRGKVLCYTYDAAINETVPSFFREIGISDIVRCNSRVFFIEESPDISNSFKSELLPGTKIPFPGFPSLNVLPIHSTELKSIGLNCFGSSSKYPTTLLTLRKPEQLPAVDQLADVIIGKSLYINWPMMHEAKVVAVSDANQIVRLVKKLKKAKKFNKAESQRWVQESKMSEEQYRNGSGVPGSGGVIIGTVQIRLKLLPLQGMKTSSINGSRKKVFGKEEADVPLQMVLLQPPAPDMRFEERGPLSLRDRFPVQCDVILMKGKYRGCLATVLNTFDDLKVGVKVNALEPEPPFGLAIARSVQESYITLPDAAKVLKMSPSILGKVISSVFFNPGRYDLGLNLRYKNDYFVLGYTRAFDKSNKINKRKKDVKKKAWESNDTVFVVGNKHPDVTEDRKTPLIWEITPKAVRLIAAYRQKFPTLFSAISKYPNEHSYSASIIGKKNLPRIREWLDNIETSKLPRTPCSTEAMPLNAVAAVQRAADVRVGNQSHATIKESHIKVPPSTLYRKGSTTATQIVRASEEPPELGDRIVNLCASGIPFGLRGTIVGIHAASTGCVEVVMDKEFIGGSNLQGSCANFRGKLCVWNHLLKVSASNSMEIIEQMIPSGSGKMAIDDLFAAQNSEKPKSQQNNESPVNGCASSNEETMQATKPTKPHGSLSRGRAKQGYWMEARGPTDGEIGFKGYGRGGLSGLQLWRQALSKKEPTAKMIPTFESKEKQLKNILGLTTSSPVSAPLPTLQSKSPTAPISAPPLTTQHTSAADALLQMMSHSPQIPPESNTYTVPQHSEPFNFTYVQKD